MTSLPPGFKVINVWLYSQISIKQNILETDSNFPPKRLIRLIEGYTMIYEEFSLDVTFLLTVTQYYG